MTFSIEIDISMCVVLKDRIKRFYAFSVRINKCLLR